MAETGDLEAALREVTVADVLEGQASFVKHRKVEWEVSQWSPSQGRTRTAAGRAAGLFPIYNTSEQPKRLNIHQKSHI